MPLLIPSMNPTCIKASSGCGIGWRSTQAQLMTDGHPSMRSLILAMNAVIIVADQLCSLNIERDDGMVDSVTGMKYGVVKYTL